MRSSLPLPTGPTPEERLLRALFNEYEPMPKEVCKECQREVDKPVFFNGEPYHSICLARRFE